jgi:hypothetical protein
MAAPALLHPEVTALLMVGTKGKGTPKKLATAISEKCHRFQACNWFPD